MFRFQKLVDMITPDFYFVKRIFYGAAARKVLKIDRPLAGGFLSLTAAMPLRVVAAPCGRII